MNVETITSRKNELLSHIRKLQSSRAYRYEMGQFSADGFKLLGEAIKCSLNIEAVIFCEGAELPENIGETTRLCKISRPLMESVSELEAPQGVIFTCSMPERTETPNLNGAIILDGIQDPGNMGTLLRTADAMGVKAVIIVNNCADIYNPKVVRAAMGAVFRLPVYSFDTDELLGELKEQGIKLVASALTDSARDIRASILTGCAVIIGSEGSGVSARLLDAADEAVIIPMSQMSESLNAAVAGSIIMWEMRRNDLR